MMNKRNNITEHHFSLRSDLLNNGHKTGIECRGYHTGIRGINGDLTFPLGENIYKLTGRKYINF